MCNRAACTEYTLSPCSPLSLAVARPAPSKGTTTEKQHLKGAKLSLMRVAHCRLHHACTAKQGDIEFWNMG